MGKRQPPSEANSPTEETVYHIPRVLIVEDTLELGELIQETIERMRLMPFRETHGLKALERFDEIRPDIVLLDIGLPDMTGWRVLDKIKEVRDQTHRPAVIVMTAYGDPANRLMGKLQGVDEYLIKPFTTEDLQAIVRRVLHQDSGENH